jgi:hypothetical protein
MLWFTPIHRDIFLVTELVTILGIESSFCGVWSGFLLRFISFVLSFLSYDFLTTFVCSGSESFSLLLSLAVFLTHIRGFLLDNSVYTRVVFLQDAYIHVLLLNNHVHQPLLIFCWVWWLLGRF